MSLVPQEKDDKSEGSNMNKLVDDYSEENLADFEHESTGDWD